MSRCSFANIVIGYAHRVRNIPPVCPDVPHLHVLYARNHRACALNRETQSDQDILSDPTVCPDVPRFHVLHARNYQICALHRETQSRNMGHTVHRDLKQKKNDLAICRYIYTISMPSVLHCFRPLWHRRDIPIRIARWTDEACTASDSSRVCCICSIHGAPLTNTLSLYYWSHNVLRLVFYYMQTEKIVS